MTSASLTSMAISGGASSSSYSSAWRRSRSGEGRRSESGPEPVGDAGAGLGCAVSRAWKANGGCTDLFPKRSDMAASSSSECISMSSEGRVDGGRSRAPARLDMAVLGGSRNGEGRRARDVLEKAVQKAVQAVPLCTPRAAPCRQVAIKYPQKTIRPSISTFSTQRLRPASVGIAARSHSQYPKMDLPICSSGNIPNYRRISISTKAWLFSTCNGLLHTLLAGPL